MKKGEKINSEVVFTCQSCGQEFPVGDQTPSQLKDVVTEHAMTAHGGICAIMPDANLQYRCRTCGWKVLDKGDGTLEEKVHAHAMNTGHTMIFPVFHK